MRGPPTGAVLRGGRTGGEQLVGPVWVREMGRPVSLTKKQSQKPHQQHSGGETIALTSLVYLFRVIKLLTYNGIVVSIYYNLVLLP